MFTGPIYNPKHYYFQRHCQSGVERATWLTKCKPKPHSKPMLLAALVLAILTLAMA